MSAGFVRRDASEAEAMSAYDQWKESGPVDALTAAEAEADCPSCGHDHTQRSREPDEVSAFVPGHSDFCDCTYPEDDGPDPDRAREEMLERSWPDE